MRKCGHTSGRVTVTDLSRWTGGEPDLVETEDWSGWAVQGICEYGNCVEFCCPRCGCNKYGGLGPVMCPCQDWIAYRDMRAKRKVAVKPSLGTNGRRRRKTRRLK